mmetsp:Transcript_33747/g.80418  ORF Transcript_33747/g.80418 Transcript_33747/m.80418 type:complete len:205 (+) Transcript_33747:126-740(+)
MSSISAALTSSERVDCTHTCTSHTTWVWKMCCSTTCGGFGSLPFISNFRRSSLRRRAWVQRLTCWPVRLRISDSVSFPFPSASKSWKRSCRPRVMPPSAPRHCISFRHARPTPDTISAASTMPSWFASSRSISVRVPSLSSAAASAFSLLSSSDVSWTLYSLAYLPTAASSACFVRARSAATGTETCSQIRTILFRERFLVLRP